MRELATATTTVVSGIEVDEDEDNTRSGEVGNNIDNNTTDNHFTREMLKMYIFTLKTALDGFQRIIE